jgi:hypothetical protein
MRRLLLFSLGFVLGYFGTEATEHRFRAGEGLARPLPLPVALSAQAQ